MRDRPGHPDEPGELDGPDERHRGGDHADPPADRHAYEYVDQPADQPVRREAPAEARTWADFELVAPDEADGPDREPLGELRPEPPDELADDVALLHRDLVADRYAEPTEVDRRAEPGRDSDTDALATPAAEEPREGDRPAAVDVHVDRPDFQDTWEPHRVPDRYGDPLREGRDRPVPLFDGEPRREDTEQGQLGDCGVIAVLGAVAAHRPETIKERVRENDDGSYEVSLFEATHSGDTGRSEPTGRTIRMTVTPDVPVFDAAPDEPAFANGQRAAWPAVLEKASAGVDATWTQQRRERWEARWDRTWEDIRTDLSLPKDTPRAPTPTGYERLNYGTTPGDRAEVLTQLTGRPAEVRTLDRRPGAETRVAWGLLETLAEDRPVLVGTRQLREGEKELPHLLVESHAYEVVGMVGGTVRLRNPWNDDHPDPLSVRQFLDNVQPWYTTLAKEEDTDDG